MIKIEYPPKKPGIRQVGGREEIFCIIRKSWMILTPEEWVRQNFLLYLTEVLKFPASLIAVEKQLLISEVKKRFDIVVYTNTMNPHILVECKEMEVKLTHQVMDQLLVYYASIQSPFLVITNGVLTFAFKKMGNNLVPVESEKEFLT